MQVAPPGHVLVPQVCVPGQVSAPWQEARPAQVAPTVAHDTVPSQVTFPGQVD